jgi:hypothetical protein
MSQFRRELRAVFCRFTVTRDRNSERALSLKHQRVVLSPLLALFYYETCRLCTECVPSTELLGAQSSLAETERTPANLDNASSMI